MVWKCFYLQRRRNNYLRPKKKLKVLEDMQGPMQQEVLKLRGHNQSLLEKLNKIRSSFEVKLALQKSQMLKQTLSTNLYNASHRKRNTLTPESIMTVFAANVSDAIIKIIATSNGKRLFLKLAYNGDYLWNN